MHAGRRKRDRVTVACEPCRKGKRKCDGCVPACSLCRTHGKTCVYPGLQRRKRVQVSDLEAEIARLESVVDDLQKEDASSVSTLHSPETQTPIVGGVDQGSTATNDLSVLSWDTTETISGQNVFYGPTGLLSSPALAGLRKSSTLGGSSNSTAKIHSDVARACLHDEGFRRRLIDDFDVSANASHRFVESQTLHSLKTSSSVPVKLHLLYAAVVACGAFLSAHPEVKDMCSLFVDSAQSIALTSCQAQANLYVVQGLNILAWLELGRGNGTSSWMFTSMAGAMAVHQGLHIQDDNAESKHLPLQTRQNRARTFWSFFWVNRLVAAVLGRTPYLPKSQAKVPTLALLSSSTTPPAVEDACLDSLCQLWSLHDQHMERVLSFDFPALPAAEKESVLRTARLALNQFYGGVDARLRTPTTSPPSPSPVYFQISYHVSLILLHRPFLASTPPPLFSSALRALSAAASAVTDLLPRLRQTTTTTPPTVPPPFLIYHVLRAAAVLLLLATSSPTTGGMPSSRPSKARNIAARVRLCLEVLEDAGRTWRDLSAHAVRAVREMAARWGVVWVLPLRWSAPVGGNGGEGGRGGGLTV